MIEEPAFWKYLIFDEEEGGAIGIQENAPEEIKKEYKEFLEINKTEKL